MKEEPSDSSQASNADDNLLSSILLLKEEPPECGIKDEPTESAFDEVGSFEQTKHSQRDSIQAGIGDVEVPNDRHLTGSCADGSAEKCMLFPG